MDAIATANLQEVMNHVEAIFKVIDKYETCKPGMLGITKLEEAILWLQVMIQKVPLKSEDPKKVDENKEAIPVTV